MTDAQDLGRAIGNIAYQQARVQENISPDDPNGQFLLFANKRAVVHGRLRTKKRYYASTSFVLDHPVQGVIDSATYALDGGYNDALEVVALVFNEGNKFREPLYNDGFVDTDNTSATIDTGNLTVTF